jgi:hypothetical protein
VEILCELTFRRDVSPLSSGYCSCSHLLTLVPRSRIFYPADWGDTFLRNIGSHKIYTAPHLRRRHSSKEGLSVETVAWCRSCRIFPLHFQNTFTNSIRMQVAGMNYLREAAGPIRDQREGGTQQKLHMFNVTDSMEQSFLRRCFPTLCEHVRSLRCSVTRVQWNLGNPNTR